MVPRPLESWTYPTSCGGIRGGAGLGKTQMNHKGRDANVTSHGQGRVVEQDVGDSEFSVMAVAAVL